MNTKSPVITEKWQNINVIPSITTRIQSEATFFPLEILQRSLHLKYQWRQETCIIIMSNLDGSGWDLCFLVCCDQHDTSCPESTCTMINPHPVELLISRTTFKWGGGGGRSWCLTGQVRSERSTKSSISSLFLLVHSWLAAACIKLVGCLNVWGEINPTAHRFFLTSMW